MTAPAPERLAEPNPQMLFCDPIGPWHGWFAWRPVRTYDQRFIWLKWCRRRCMQKHDYLYGGPLHTWQYHAGRALITGAHHA